MHTIVILNPWQWWCNIISIRLMIVKYNLFKNNALMLCVVILLWGFIGNGLVGIALSGRVY